MTEIETHASKELPACTRRGMRSGKRDALGAWWRGWEAKIGARGGTPIHYLYGYVPPNGVVILKLLI